MKKFLYILCALILLSSCRSYQKLDLDNLKIKSTKKYKITKKNGNMIRSKIYINDDNTITIYLKKEKMTLNISEIESIDGKKYSEEKTINSILIMTSVILSLTMK